MENKCVTIPFVLRNGVEMNKCAVALFALSTSGSGSSLILSSALARASGFLDKTAPFASANYSRFLLTASFMSSAITGARIARRNATMIKMIVS